MKNRLNAQVIPMPMIGGEDLEIVKLFDDEELAIPGYSFCYKGKRFVCAEGEGDGPTCTSLCQITLNSLAAYSKENMGNSFAVFLCRADTSKTKRRETFYQLLDGLKTETAIMIMIDDIKKCEPVVELLKFTINNPFNAVS